MPEKKVFGLIHMFVEKAGSNGANKRRAGAAAWCFDAGKASLRLAQHEAE